MNPKIICTNSGNLHLEPINENILSLLKNWPKGLRMTQIDGETVYGITFEDQEGKLLGLGVEYGYYSDEKDALEVFLVQRSMLPYSIQEYLKNGFDGILFPCPYLKQASSNYWLTGYLLFGYSKGYQDAGLKAEPIQFYEELFGKGGTNLLLSFIASEANAWNTAGLPKRTISGLEPAQLSHYKTVALELFIVGPNVVCILKKIKEDDPTWEQLVKAGVRHIFHMPSMPLKLKEKE